MIPFFFLSSLLLEAFFLLDESEYSDFAPIGSSLVLHVVVVFGDVNTAGSHRSRDLHDGNAGKRDC